MGRSALYGQVITEEGSIPPHEPVFMVRARDTTAVEVIANYLVLCVRTGSSRQHLNRVLDTLIEFQNWQKLNEDDLKIPNSRRHGGMADV